MGQLGWIQSTQRCEIPVVFPESWELPNEWFLLSKSIYNSSMRTLRTLPCPAVKKTETKMVPGLNPAFFSRYLIVSHCVSLRFTTPRPSQIFFRIFLKVHAAARIAVSRHNSGRRPRRASGWSFLKTWGLHKESPPNQWEFQDPKMEVLYHIRPYFGGISWYIHLYRPYIGLIYGWNGHWPNFSLKLSRCRSPRLRAAPGGHL